MRLAAETEALDGLLIAFRGGILEVIKETAAQRHQLQQTAAGGEIFLVGAEVRGEVQNALAQKRDLVISTARVAGVQLILCRIDIVIAHFRWVFGSAARPSWSTTL